MRIIVNLNLHDSTVQIIPLLRSSCQVVEDVNVSYVVSNDEFVTLVAAHILGGRLLLINHIYFSEPSSSQ